jgi:hypothetical protein
MKIFRFQSLCFLIFCICSVSFADRDDDLHQLIFKLKKGESLTHEDKKLFDPLWKQYEKGSKLSVVEDNTVYYYLKNTNDGAEKFFHPRFPKWVAYKRLDAGGYRMVIEELVEDGVLHEFSQLEKDAPVPWHCWHPTKLDFYFEDNEAPYRKIARYSVKNAKLEPIVENMEDNYSPIISPDGLYLTYLSNRARLSKEDTRTHVYVKQLEDPGKPDLRITGLMQFEFNTLENPRRLFFKDNDTLVYMVAGEKTELPFAISIQRAQKLHKETMARQMMQQENAKKNKYQRLPGTGDSFSKTLLRKKVKTGVLTVYSRSGEVFTQFNHVNHGKRLLGVMKQDWWNNRKGFGLIAHDTISFFLRSNGNRYSVWAQDSSGSEPVLASRRSENCFGMFYQPKLEILAYVLRRESMSFVVAVDWQARREVEWVEVVGMAEPEAGEPLLNIDEYGNITFKDKTGGWTPLKSSLDSQSGEGPQFAKEEQGVEISDGRVIPRETLPKIEAPYHFDYDVDSIPGEPKSLEQFIKSEPGWKPMAIEGALAALEKKVWKIRDVMGLHEAKIMYNMLHYQLRIKHEHWKDAERQNKQRWLVVWTKQLNKIKEKIDSTSILVAEE